MAKINETTDDQFGVIDGLNDILNKMWSSAERNLTTSQELDRMTPAQIKKYKQDRETWEATKKIHQNSEEALALLKEGKTKKRGLWNAIWHGLGIVKSEGDKLFKE